jgi:hypothetical protein
MKKLSKIFGSSVAIAVALVTSASTTQGASVVNPGFENAGGFTGNPISLSGLDQGWATFGAGQTGTHLINSAI